jgi:hypothetical protein
MSSSLGTVRRLTVPQSRMSVDVQSWMPVEPWIVVADVVGGLCEVNLFDPIRNLTFKPVEHFPDRGHITRRASVEEFVCDHFPIRLRLGKFSSPRIQDRAQGFRQRLCLRPSLWVSIVPRLETSRGARIWICHNLKISGFRKPPNTPRPAARRPLEARTKSRPHSGRSDCEAIRFPLRGAGEMREQLVRRRP